MNAASSATRPRHCCCFAEEAPPRSKFACEPLHAGYPRAPKTAQRGHRSRHRYRTCTFTGAARLTRVNAAAEPEYRTCRVYNPYSPSSVQAELNSPREGAGSAASKPREALYAFERLTSRIPVFAQKHISRSQPELPNSLVTELEPLDLAAGRFG